MVTKKGIIKRTLLSEYEYQRKNGKIALRLDEDDELVFVMHTTGNKEIVLATRYGNAVKYSEQNVRPMGRTARGVRGIKLREGDYVTGVAIVDENKKLVTITENGFGKCTDFEDFRVMKNRGGYGVVCHKLSEKTGELCSIATVGDEDDLMMITDTGTIIRTPVAGIPSYSRTAGGVIMMRLSEGQKLVNFTRVPHEESEEEETVEPTAEQNTEALASEAPQTASEQQVTE
jgi:DNA gyrase subunit A